MKTLVCLGIGVMIGGAMAIGFVSMVALRKLTDELEKWQ